MRSENRKLVEALSHLESVKIMLMRLLGLSCLGRRRVVMLVANVYTGIGWTVLILKIEVMVVMAAITSIVT